MRFHHGALDERGDIYPTLRRELRVRAFGVTAMGLRRRRAFAAGDRTVIRRR